MATDPKMLDLIDRLPLTALGRKILPELMSGTPIRKVQSHIGNVITSFFSPKMGFDILTEAVSTEFSLAQEKERDSNVAGYWPQAYRFHLAYVRNGKHVRTTHVPDITSIQTFPPRLILEETKTEEEWVRISRQHVGWVIKEDGRWRNPTLEELFGREYGYEYRLRSAAEFSQQLIANYNSLAAYYAATAVPVSDAGYAEIQDQFCSRSSMPMHELVAAGVSVDDVYKSIVEGLVAFDLENDDIDDTAHAVIYRDRVALRMFRRAAEQHNSAVRSSMLSSLVPGSKLIYDSVTYVAKVVGNRKAMLVAEHGSVEVDLSDIVRMIQSDRAMIVDGGTCVRSEGDFEAMEPLTRKQMDVAGKRLAALTFAEEHPGESPFPPRTLQRWEKLRRDSGSNLSDQLAALAPRTGSSGNREGRLHPALVSAFAKTVAEHNSVRAPNGASSYKEYCLLCMKEEQRPISRSAFYKKLKKVKSIRKREGKRRAYQTDPIVAYLEHKINVHGTRPMQAVHIDHTPIDLEITDKTGEINLSSVWLTLAMDAASRAVVGFVLSFEKPSYRSCMMVLRDIVRRMGRVPDMLVLDNGKEFHSAALRRFCSLYQIKLRFRPAGEPRYGAVMERLFGTTTTQLFNNLEGNKELLKHFRSVTKSFQPKKHARWTMPAIHGALDFFYSRLYGKESHPAHGEPPVDFFDRRLEETGQRASRLVRYDRAFMIETCPSVDDRGTRVVDNQRGVKVDWVWYWSDSFRHVDLDRKSIEVRIDPWDPRHVYALVEDRWQLCRSKLIGAMRRMTALELQYACRTMEQSSGVKQKAYTLEKLQEWADVLKPENFDSRLRLEQQEMAFVYEPLKMTSIEFAANGKSGDALVEVPSIPKPQRSAGARPEPAVSTPSAPVAGFNPNSTIKIDVEAQIETF